MKLVFNVDDFGLTSGVNEAIFKLNANNVLYSTTALVNSPHFKTGIEKAQNYPNLKIGIHLALDVFTAEVYNQTLCDQDNNFYTSKTHELTRTLKSSDIYNEWEAQIEKFIKITNKKPTHIDSHHHVHIRNQAAREAVIKIAEKYNLLVRGLTVNNTKSICIGDFYGSGVTLDNLTVLLKKALEEEADVIDFMMHPALVDEELMNISSYTHYRFTEYEILNSEQLKQFMTMNNIKITHY